MKITVAAIAVFCMSASLAAFAEPAINIHSISNCLLSMPREFTGFEFSNSADGLYFYGYTNTGSQDLYPVKIDSLDEKNGYVKIFSIGDAPGYLYDCFALFIQKNETPFIARVHTASEGNIGGLKETAISIYRYSGGEWNPCDESVLPGLSPADFYKNPEDAGGDMKLFYKLPRTGTAITVTPYPGKADFDRLILTWDTGGGKFKSGVRHKNISGKPAVIYLFDDLKGSEIPAFVKTEIFLDALMDDDFTFFKNYGGDIDLRISDDGWTALMWAALNGKTEMLKTLIKAGADVNAVNNDGGTALIAASKQGLADIITLLIKSGAKLDAADKDGNPAVWYSRDNLTYRLLVSSGARVDIFSAAKNGDTEYVTSYKGGYNVTNSGGSPPLILAVSGGHTETALALINSGADVNAADKNGNTALILAADKGNPVLVKNLIGKRAAVERTDISGWTALMWAVKKGDDSTVRLLITAGADVNAAVNKHLTYSKTVLDIALETRDPGIIMILDKAGALNSYGWTALMEASYYGQVNMARSLIGAGADVNAANKDGYTALMAAASHGQTGALNLLIDYKANVDLWTKGGLTALMIASSEGQIDAVRALVEAKAGLNKTEHGDGWTALMYAASKNRMDVVRALVEAGADVKARNWGGQTARSLTTNTAIAYILEKAGSD